MGGMSMARAKCQICKTPLDTNTAYKITDKNGKNKYFCSQSEYEAEEARKKKAKEDKDKVYRLICDLFGYEVQNTQLFAEWNLWNKLKSNEIIYKYLVENKEYLQQICNKPFEGEYQKIRYFSAVLKNSLRDFKPKVEVDKKSQVKVEIDEIIYEAPIYSLNKRRSLADLEDDL